MWGYILRHSCDSRNNHLEVCSAFHSVLYEKVKIHSDPEGIQTFHNVLQQGQTFSLMLNGI